MRDRMRRLGAVLAISAVSLVIGCRQQNAKDQTSTTSIAKIYNLRGKVISVDATAGVVTVDHEAIQGFMDAMTMPYKLKGGECNSEAAPWRPHDCEGSG